MGSWVKAVQTAMPPDGLGDSSKQGSEVQSPPANQTATHIWKMWQLSAIRREGTPHEKQWVAMHPDLTPRNRHNPYIRFLKTFRCNWCP